jgi:hypothetical protein
MAERDASPELWQRMAERARREPGYVGHVFAAYQARAGLDEAGLLRELGCDRDQLWRLALCRVPRPEQFVADLDQITARTGVDPLGLARILRLESVLGALAEQAGETRALRAARRRNDGPDGQEADDEREEPR